MTRWRIAWAVALAAAVLILLFHSKSPDLLADSDTSVLLRAIKARHAPLSWFWSDWPLYNHFYRPIPTLTFEIDQRLYGTWAAGYGWTNALICSSCVLALFWLLREICDSPYPAGAGAALFAMWQTVYPPFLIDVLTYLAILVLAIGVFRHHGKWKKYVPAVLTIFFLQRVLVPLNPVAGKVLEWLPGRTATTMTFFALVAMAAYARYERIGGPDPKPRSPSALDKPATKSSRQKRTSAGSRSQWAVVAVAATFAAFACYEQAVMLPACLFGIAVYFRLLDTRVNWWLQGAFWSVLLIYLFVRRETIPPGLSTYEHQALKTSVKGPMEELVGLLFPPLGSFASLISQFEEGFYLLLDPSFYQTILVWIIYLVGAYQLRRRYRLALAGWLLTFLAFLPMAFVQHFDHYYYWSVALRTLLVIATAAVAWSLSLTAVSPPILQAPPRLRPAPGSLPGR